MLGRPVKWIEDRREHFIGSNHERLMVHRIEVAATKEGRILGIRDRFLYDSGAYCPYGPINAQCAQAILPGPYKIPAVHTEYEAVYTNTPVVSPYRGAGQPHGNFVMEAAMNHVARALGLDAAEIRRRNLVRPEDCPWDSGRIFQGNTPFIHRDSDYPAQLAKALEALDYAGVKRSQPAEREQGIYPRRRHRLLRRGHRHLALRRRRGARRAHRPRACDDGLSLARAGPPHHAFTNRGGDAGRAARAGGGGERAERPLRLGRRHLRQPRGGGGRQRCARCGRGPFAHKALDLASDELEAAPEDLVLADGAVHVKGAPQMAVTLAALAYAPPIPSTRSNRAPSRACAPPTTTAPRMARLRAAPTE